YRLKPEFHLNLEWTLSIPQRNRVPDFVAAAGEVGIIHGATLWSDGCFNSPLVETLWQQPIVFDEANRGQKSGRRHVVRPDHYVFVYLHLVCTVDLRVMRFAAKRIGIVVVSLN